MKHVLSATAAIALLVASPLAFADNTMTGNNVPNSPSPTTTMVPDQGTSNPSMRSNGGGGASPQAMNNNTSDQQAVPPSHTSDTGNHGNDPAKVGSADDQSTASPDQGQPDGAAAPRHHHVRHVAAKGAGRHDEQEITAALNVLSDNGYTNPQGLQAAPGHKVMGKATKDGTDINVVVDPQAGTVSQQNS